MKGSIFSFGFHCLGKKKDLIDNRSNFDKYIIIHADTKILDTPQASQATISRPERFELLPWQQQTKI
jgi:hypothetical protein